MVLAKQQFGDKERAQQKENGHAEVAEEAEIVEPEMLRGINRQEIHSVDKENRKECNQTKGIQFRPIVTVNDQ
jgi:hypothetical protein